MTLRTDPVTLQIIANHCRAAAEGMAYTLYRTAHSTFVKETEDFTIQILDRDGKTCATPMDLGATWYPGLDYGEAMAMVEGVRPGDVCACSDPYAGYLATHAPDLHVWRPVFHDGEIVAYASGHIHNTDVGGAVPASLSRTLTDVQQEGIRLPPLRLVKEGSIDPELLRVLLTNVRVPEQNLGDLKAILGATATGERRIRGMIERFGRQGFIDGLADLQDYAEAQARAVLASIPDGDYDFVDYCDEDLPGGEPVRLALRLSISGDSAVLDFTGTDPQVAASLNVPTGGRPRHSLVLVGVYYVLFTLHRGITLNYGLTRPFTCIMPEGSVVNPLPPAAVGMRSLTCARLRSLVFGAFCRAAPERMPAAPAGSSSIVNVMTSDDRTGRRLIAAINPIVGGAGGMPHRDGTDGSGADAAYLKNTPVEITETEVPVRILRYGLAPDTGGAGATRGGLATELMFTVANPGSMVTARNRDRCRFRPWGLLGGGPGMPSTFTLNPGTNHARELGNIDTVKLNPGDVLRIVSPGGGGRGDPFTRDPDAVLLDVQRGFLSAEAARRDYGVVIVEGELDAAATAALRTARRPPHPLFAFGPERTAHEAVWTPEAYAAMGQAMAAIPLHWRAFLKKELFQAIGTTPVPDPVMRVATALADLAARHKPLRPTVSQYSVFGYTRRRASSSP
ncbi:hydantoinase B/oxoprolinase family protein [Limobrevibacterium gyesilva]|uniref:Hydantoinase B/oxoprolinase family protein n=1 Tax=Limobrevibacterium gyesilva TaxID=2991712 RepID=A0AA41YKQ6_9PROT|nr:hydantoinase B/oxoprolinase family protein [Limobrevibacterium gyesilva]MCW3475619.1 hydantoinase B/oxoprolinase family protein [Limobrevibacterium gyesilva]